MFTARGGAPADPHVLDLRHLAAQTFDDRALERELLDLFERQCRALAPVIAGTGPLAERSRAAHTLTGSARAIGAWEVAAAAERIEGLVGGRRTGGFADAAGALADAIRAARAAIAARNAA